MTERAKREKALDSTALLSALRYVANEAQRHPMESVRDIINEAFDRYNLPLDAEWSGYDALPIRFKFHSDNKELSTKRIEE